MHQRATTSKTVLLLASLVLTIPAVLAGADAEVEEAPGADWLAEAQSWIAGAEYHFQWDGGDLSAPNRRHDLRSFVNPEGLRVESRTAGRERFELELTPRRWLRGDEELPISAGIRVHDERRAELRRDGWTEWFVNLEDGLKHGMTLDGPPLVGEGALTLGLELGPRMQAYPNEDGTAIELRQSSSGAALRYADLVVFDALQRTLPSRMSVEGTELRIEIDDVDAVYPVTIDPLLTTAARTFQSNQGGAWMGYSLSTAGDVNGDGYSDVIIGAPLYDAGQVDEGRVFVFHGSSSGLGASASWTAESDVQSVQFGLAVSTAGDTNDDGYDDVIVATYRHTNGQTWEGKAWLYLGSSSGLATTAAWTYESNRSLGKFGHSVSAAGDVNGDGYDDVVIGEPGYSVGVSDGGAAHLVLGRPSGLGIPTTFAGPTATGQSGWDVSAAGDVNGDGYDDFLSGAPFSESGQNDEGLVHLYYGAATTGAIAEQTLQMNQNFARFGISVANAGDVNGDGRADVLIGAEFWDTGATLGTGGAFLFLGGSGGISSSPSQTLIGQVNSLFGQTVATAGDVDGDGYADIMIGAPRHDNGNSDEGRVEVYLGGPAGVGGASWATEGGQNTAYYGAAIATAGDVNGDGYSDVMVGAYRFDDGSVDEGKVFVYHGSPGALRTGASFSLGGGQASANLGFSVSRAGDVNWDGFSDVIIGAPNYDAGQTNEGRAYVFHGSASGLPATPNTTLEENQGGANLGHAVSDAGDVNGDGYDDVIVGAPLWDAGSTDEGRVFLYLGSSSGVSSTATWTAESNDAFSLFGSSISRAGDVNGDGFGDVLVGAYAYSSQLRGAAFVYHGGTSLPSSPSWSYVSTVNGWLGWSVSGGGDFNRDGFSDIVVGAPYYNAATEGGRVLVFHGGSGGLGGAPDQTLNVSQPNAEYGFSVAYAGDMNRDGHSDFLVGAPLYDDNVTDGGAVFTYRGRVTSATGFGYLVSNIPNVCFGCSVAGAGDPNGDGYDDILTGAYESNQGRVTLWHGRGNAFGPSATPDWSVFGTISGDEYGRSIDGAGDINGDGFEDVIVGAPNYDFNSSFASEGRAFVYYGGGGSGLSQERRQSGGVATTPVALLGRSDDDDSFRVRFRARTAAGRSRLRMHLLAYDSVSGTLAGELLTETVRTYTPGSAGTSYNFWRQVPNLQDGPNYRWIVRSIGRNPYFPRSPWRWLPGNGQREADLSSTCVPASWYLDSDGDGYGDPAIETVNCTAPADYVADGTDCDDADGAVNPGAVEIICDGLDSNCDGGADEAPDLDGDGIDICDVSDPVNPDGVGVDNCPATPNPSQHDNDDDGAGDACDPCPSDPADDVDADGVCGDVDNCPFAGNPAQADADADGVGDVCDLCALAPDPGQEDGDTDGTGDACDNCPTESNPAQTDGDADTFGDACDCAPADGTTWAVAGPVVNLVMDSSGGQTTLTWDPPVDPGADVGVLLYDVLASFDTSDFVGLALCLSIDQSATTYVDTLNPGPGQMFSYLVRAENGCGEGSNGLLANGQERPARACD